MSLFYADISLNIEVTYAQLLKDLNSASRYNYFLKSNNYYELRDSISQDWINYFNNFFPETKWILIPNSEENILRYIELWKINAFIFSGGEDFGITKMIKKKSF